MGGFEYIRNILYGACHQPFESQVKSEYSKEGHLLHTPCIGSIVWLICTFEKLHLKKKKKKLRAYTIIITNTFYLIIII